MPLSGGSCPALERHSLPMNLKKGPLIFNNLRILRFMGSMREFIRGILSLGRGPGVRENPVSLLLGSGLERLYQSKCMQWTAFILLFWAALRVLCIIFGSAAQIKKTVDALKMCAISPLLRARKLTGQARVFYNRGMRVRGSPHPCFCSDYAAFLFAVATESSALRIQSGLRWPAWRIASLICFASGGVNRAARMIPLAFCVPTFGLPTLLFIINVHKKCRWKNRIC
jgi:hypothetical protein